MPNQLSIGRSACQPLLCTSPLLAKLGLDLQGVAINFVKSDDIRILRDIEQYYSTQVDEMVGFASDHQQYLFYLMMLQLTYDCVAAHECGGLDLKHQCLQSTLPP